MFSLHEFIKLRTPRFQVLVLGIGVWWGRYLGIELDHMLDVFGYVFESMICTHLAVYHHHESVGHAIQ
jgi:hypothetical protein